MITIEKRELDPLNRLLHSTSKKKPTREHAIIKYRMDKARKGTEMETWEEHVEANYGCKCYLCPGLYANELKKFVGFRGTTKSVKQFEKENTCKSHAQGELCIIDIKGQEIEGEAHPPPIVPITKHNIDNLQRLTKKLDLRKGQRYFIGILRYEVETMTLMYILRGMGFEDIMVLMPRGHGKTYMNCWDNCLSLKWFKQNIMMLSVTSAKFKVGNWTYVWALRNNYLKDPEKFARKSTYQHFVLHNEARMDIYDWKKEDMVGEHDYKLKQDDIIKKDWKNKPSYNEQAKEHWQSNLNFIIRTGNEIYGTRKDEDDVLGHMIKTIEDLIIIKLSPFIPCEHNPYLNENGVYDECHICKDDCLLAPEIHGFNELMNKKEEDYEAWHSEMMQNPHRKEGGMVSPEDIAYVNRPHWTEGVIMGGTGVDLADTLNERNDMCGVVSCLSQRLTVDKRDKRYFTFYSADVARRLFRNSEVKEKKKPYDWTDYHDDGSEKRVVRGVIETVQIHCNYHMNNYPNIPYIVAVERNKSGIALIEQALREFRLGAKVEINKGEWVDLTWPAYIIPDKGKAVKLPHSGDTNIPLGINHQGLDKERRVEGELKYSIINSQTRFTPSLKYTVFMEQLLGFPKAKHDDGPDAGGMIKDELNRRWQKSVPKRKSIDVQKAEKESAKFAKQFKELQNPLLRSQRGRKRII